MVDFTTARGWLWRRTSFLDGEGWGGWWGDHLAGLLFPYLSVHRYVVPLP